MRYFLRFDFKEISFFDGALNIFAVIIESGIVIGIRDYPEYYVSGGVHNYFGAKFSHGRPPTQNFRFIF